MYCRARGAGFPSGHNHHASSAATTTTATPAIDQIHIRRDITQSSRRVAEQPSQRSGCGESNYAYDASGNRTQADGQTFTYDGRDRLTEEWEAFRDRKDSAAIARSRAGGQFVPLAAALESLGVDPHEVEALLADRVGGEAA